MPRAVLFDLDGTLVELGVDIEAVRARLAAMFAPYGYRERFAPILARIAEASAFAGADDAERAALFDGAMALLADAEREAASTATPIDGARDVVATLSAAAVPIGILTNNGRACVDPALARLGARASWRVVVSRDDAPAKPDPSGLVTAARALLPAGGTLWFVADGDRDIAAAKAAKAQHDVAVISVGFVRGASAQRMAAAEPDEQIDDLRRLLALVGLG